jgi:hypothetical protein
MVWMLGPGRAYAGLGRRRPPLLSMTIPSMDWKCKHTWRQRVNPWIGLVSLKDEEIMDSDGSDRGARNGTERVPIRATPQKFIYLSETCNTIINRPMRDETVSNEWIKSDQRGLNQCNKSSKCP